MDSENQDSRMAAEAKKEKQRALSVRSKRNLLVIPGLILGISLGLLIGALVAGRQGAAEGVLPGMLAGILSASLLGKVIFRPARCPKCELAWEVKEQVGKKSDFETWKNCPGCGLKIP